MAGIVMIDSDEYRELVLAKEAKDEIEKELDLTDRRLMQKEYEFKELLLLITKGEFKTKYDEGKFQSYDIASNYDLVDFVNENYVENGLLKFNKVKKENTNE